MLQTVTIQNFKSLKDVTVRLQKVNLLIGPNNSGKSNFLKALAFLKEHYAQRIQPSITNLDRLYFKQGINTNPIEIRTPITFSFRWEESSKEFAFYQLELLGYENNDLIYNEAIGYSLKSIKKDFKLKELDYSINTFARYSVLFHKTFNRIKSTVKSEIHSPITRPNLYGSVAIYCENKNAEYVYGEYGSGHFLSNNSGTNNISRGLNSIKIYKPDPSRITKENMLLFDKQVNEDCSNLVAFLDNMRDEYDDVWQSIQKELTKCLPDFVGINFEKVKVNNSENLGKKFGLRDKNGKTYWADELSEGTIYFLALLAIVHQPNPPRVLLLEEPEKGIHPRRISEVMDLIFRLAEEKDIQIILTTHSTQLVDEFQDIPESVFVFDIQDGETKIKNLLTDIIAPDNEKAETKGYQKLDFNKHTLGEHWAIGFLGGVPSK